MSENCYFFIENDHMAAVCEECHTKEGQNLGWFWPGALKSYGVYDIICKFCKKPIHESAKNDS